MKAIVYSRASLKTLRRIPANVAATIRAKIEQYASAPEELVNNLIKLQGVEDAYRLRVGDWRVVFTEAGEIIAVVKIAPRGGAYD